MINPYKKLSVHQKLKATLIDKCTNSRMGIFSRALAIFRLQAAIKLALLYLCKLSSFLLKVKDHTYRLYIKLGYVFILMYAV